MLQAKEPRITWASISAMPKTLFDPLPTVTITMDTGEVKKLFTFFPDEISFTEGEFVGLTEKEARALKAKKDKNYLVS